ncbi:MAG: hypothetical protein Q9170_002159 [Blastenia crenularia]
MGRTRGSKNHPKASAAPNKGEPAKLTKPLGNDKPMNFVHIERRLAGMNNVLVKLLMQNEDKPDNKQALMSTGDSRNRGAPRNVIRYFLAERDDRERVQKMERLQIVETFRQSGGAFEHIRAVYLKDQVLNLYLDSSDCEKAIREHDCEIADMLQLSVGCKALYDQYLVVALSFDFDKRTLPNPNERREAWSEANGVKIVKAFWTHSQLILSLASAADALTLCNKPRVFLEGTQGYVKWNLACANTNVVAMRDKCTYWRKRGPGWAPPCWQRSLSGAGALEILDNTRTGTQLQNTGNKGTVTGEKENLQKRKLSMETEIGSQQTPKKMLLFGQLSGLCPSNTQPFAE